MAVYTYNKPPKKVSEFSWPFCDVATLFCIYKGFSEKYKGKNAIRLILLPFLQKRLNQFNSLARLLYLYSWFSRHPYWPSFFAICPYGNMAIWLKKGLMAISPYGNKCGQTQFCFYEGQFRLSRQSLGCVVIFSKPHAQYAHLQSGQISKISQKALSQGSKIWYGLPSNRNIRISCEKEILTPPHINPILTGKWANFKYILECKGSETL